MLWVVIVIYDLLVWLRSILLVIRAISMIQAAPLDTESAFRPSWHRRWEGWAGRRQT